MKVRARWAGTSPSVGDYLMSPTRPRFAYRVCTVMNSDRSVGWDPVLKTEIHHLTIIAERVSLDAVPKDARVHPWRWDKRESRKKIP